MANDLVRLAEGERLEVERVEVHRRETPSFNLRSSCEIYVDVRELTTNPEEEIVEEPVYNDGLLRVAWSYLKKLVSPYIKVHTQIGVSDGTLDGHA